MAKEAFRLVEQLQAYQGEEVLSYMFHAYGTNLQFDEGEFNFVKDRRPHGTKQAFKIRDEHFEIPEPDRPLGEGVRGSARPHRPGQVGEVVVELARIALAEEVGALTADEQETAVDHQRGAGGVRRVVGEQEGDRPWRCPRARRPA